MAWYAGKPRRPLEQTLEKSAGQALAAAFQAADKRVSDQARKCVACHDMMTIQPAEYRAGGDQRRYKKVE